MSVVSADPGAGSSVFRSLVFSAVVDVSDTGSVKSLISSAMLVSGRILILSTSARNRAVKRLNTFRI